VLNATNLTPALSLKRRGSKPKHTETARCKCQEVAFRSDAEQEVENRESFFAGWNPAVREPPKRRHFATNTVAAGTRPFRPCAASIYQQQKNAGFQRVSFKTLWARVGGEPTVLTLRPV